MLLQQIGEWTLNHDKWCLIDVPRAVLPSPHSFERLPADPYCGGQHRFKRFSQFRIDPTPAGWSATLLPHRPFFQSPEYNSFAGGVPRHYEPVEFVPTKLIQALAELFALSRAEPWQVDFHQNRIVTTAKIPGISVPEGPHQDGHPLAAIVVVNRRGVAGGETIVYSIDRDQPIELFRHTLLPCQGIAFRDSEILHTATDIEPVTEEVGIRDLAIFSFDPWSKRTYGPAFEALCRGEAREW